MQSKMNKKEMLRVTVGDATLTYYNQNLDIRSRNDSGTLSANIFNCALVPLAHLHIFMHVDNTLFHLAHLYFNNGGAVLKVC